MVELASAAAVPLHGEAAQLVRLRVIDFAMVGGDIARFVPATAVSHLHRSAGGAGEHTSTHADIDHP